MTMANLIQLRVVLLALLPKDGTPMSVAGLAKAASCTKHDVTDALFADYMDGSIRFDMPADSFSAIKKGNAL